MLCAQPSVHRWHSSSEEFMNSNSRSTGDAHGDHRQLPHARPYGLHNKIRNKMIVHEAPEMRLQMSLQMSIQMSL